LRIRHGSLVLYHARMGSLTSPVAVRVPATSANLGPGFDSLGVALELHDTITARVAGDEVRVSVAGQGADELPTDERHLIAATMLETFDRLGERPVGLDLKCENAIPEARGFGVLPVPALPLPPGTRIAIVCDNFSPHLTTAKDAQVGAWAAASNVEIAYTPTSSSWLNRIEAQFTALRYFTLDGTDHASHHEQASMIRRYIIWRNNHAYDERLRQVVDRANVA
jgi:hypothetical protein